MALNQKTFIGDEEDYQFGPGQIYYNTSAGFIPAGYVGATGTGYSVGDTGPVEVTFGADYVEGKSIQTGTQPNEYAISGQKCSMTTTLKQAGLDRLELMADGISVERDTDGVPIRFGLVDITGTKKSANAMQLTYVGIEGGLEKWDEPLQIVDFFKVIPLSADAKSTVDAESFREFSVEFRVLRSDELDHLGRKAYFLSRYEGA